ncbi:MULTISPECIES: C40 family peptidase [Flavobacterium]|uniref:C40 family peptidase n=1 Tax=Flavobacterium TaxID=237 RepID=UPI003918A5F6
MLFFACKPAATIVTSKEVAVKKGLYTEPKPVATTETKSVEKKKKNTNPAVASKPVVAETKTSKKVIVDTPNESDILIDNENTSYLVRQLINSASENLGVGYRGGGTTKDGFDCSGLIYSTFKKFDITLPRSSHEMATVGTKIDLKNAQKGDLIFFINRGQRRINHVGMVVEVTEEEVKFIHSSTQSGVIISSTKEPYYNRTFVQINRIL